MAVSNPTEFVPLGRLEYQTTREIQASDWTDLIEANNFRYRFDGVRAYEADFDPAFVRPDSETDGEYSVTDASGNQDLDELVPVCVARRPLESGGSVIYQWQLEVYGQYFDVRANLYREDDASRTNILTLTTSDSSGSWVWSDTTGTTTDAEVRIDANTANDPQVLTWEVEARSSDATNPASILQIRTSASRISAASFYPTDFEV